MSVLFASAGCLTEANKHELNFKEGWMEVVLFTYDDGHGYQLPS